MTLRRNSQAPAPFLHRDMAPAVDVGEVEVAGEVGAEVGEGEIDCGCQLPQGQTRFR